MSLTPAQIAALRWLDRRGGEAVLNRYARAMAQGDKSGADPGTWLRLILLGHIERAGPLRFRLTDQGREAAR